MKIAVIKTKFGYIKKIINNGFNNFGGNYMGDQSSSEFSIEFTQNKKEACTYLKRSIGEACKILMIWLQDNNQDYEFQIEQIIE